MVSFLGNDATFYLVDLGTSYPSEVGELELAEIADSTYYGLELYNKEEYTFLDRRWKRIFRCSFSRSTI